MTSTRNEDEVAEKFENVVIIGSCGVFILITIVLIIMIRKYSSNKKQLKIYQYKSTPTSSLTAKANYNKMFCQGGNVPEIYKNTQNTTLFRVTIYMYMCIYQPY